MKWLQRMQARQAIKGLERELNHYLQQQAGLPLAIERTELALRQQIGRLDTLRQPRSRVSYTLSGVRSLQLPITRV